jgi:ribose 5-phosphate isomerase
MEDALEVIPGVVACGIFARWRADVILVGRDDGSVFTLIPDEAGSSR